MTMIPRLSIAAATLFLVWPAGMSANAQQPAGACYQSCRIQYNWPASQCASYCRARATGQSEMFAPAPRRTYGYSARGAFPGGCGTYMYWKDGRCLDARNK